MKAQLAEVLLETPGGNLAMRMVGMTFMMRLLARFILQFVSSWFC